MHDAMSIEYMFEYCLSSFEGLVEDKNWGERGIFYNPDDLLPKGVYVLTFKEKDGPNDKASQVNREGVFRLNLGICKDSFIQLFGSIPKRPAAGEIVDTGHDFGKLDSITPHPVYGWMSWIAVLNPSAATFETLKPLIAEGVELARQKYLKKIKK
jgi:hypothetical protein